jgi:hypothetical protein
VLLAYIVLWFEPHEGLETGVGPGSSDGTESDPLPTFTSEAEAMEWAKRKRWPQKNIEILAVRLDTDEVPAEGKPKPKKPEPCSRCGATWAINCSIPGCPRI